MTYPYFSIQFWIDFCIYAPGLVYRYYKIRFIRLLKFPYWKLVKHIAWVFLQLLKMINKANLIYCYNNYCTLKFCKIAIISIALWIIHVCRSND
jgi:hypothetical protein